MLLIGCVTQETRALAVENPMESQMARFPKNEIISLIGEMPRYDLGESTGPDLRVGGLLDASAQQELIDIALSYGTAAGDPR